MKQNSAKFKKMSVRQLKTFLADKNIETSDCLEKSDLINKIEYHGLHWEAGEERKEPKSAAQPAEPTSAPEPEPDAADGSSSAPSKNNKKNKSKRKKGKENKEADVKTQVDMLVNEGLMWKGQGHLPNAINSYERALALDRCNQTVLRYLAIVHSDLGSALRCENRKEEGKLYYHKSLAADCTYPAAWYNLGVCFAEMRLMDQAQVHYQMCVRFDPDYAEANNNLGAHFKDRGNNEQAIWHYQEAVRAKPQFALAYSNLASLYHGMGKVELAQEAGEKAIKVQPNFAEAHNNLGSVYLDQGLSERAVASFQKCLDLEPHNDRLKADNNKLLAMNFLPPQYPGGGNEDTAEDRGAADLLNARIWEAHRVFGKKFASKYTPFTRWPNVKTFNRPIRVGFLSSDFKTHSVSFFAEAPLRHMDAAKIEFYCYLSGPGDSKTETVFKKVCPASRWRSLELLDLDTVCNMIRADKIDILVELGGHSAGSRLDVMARKPAPVQVTWIGYANTTGLTTIDYRITDEVADPLDTRQKYSEQLVRMPKPFCFLCYTPNSDVPAVGPTPALANGYITFGSFNALGKINDRVIDLWCKVLTEVANSRFLMKCKHFASPDIKQRFLSKFEAHGIDKSRLTLLAMTPTIAEHLALYNKVDIAVDSFPYAGTTTTAEALYMGVPVVVLYRNETPIHAQNVGASLLARIEGLKENFVANSRQEYVDICKRFAKDPASLAAIRDTMRHNMVNSPMCDGPSFCRALEEVFVEMWKCHCQGKKMTRF